MYRDTNDEPDLRMSCANPDITALQRLVAAQFVLDNGEQFDTIPAAITRARAALGLPELTSDPAEELAQQLRLV